MITTGDSSMIGFSAELVVSAAKTVIEQLKHNKMQVIKVANFSSFLLPP